MNKKIALVTGANRGMGLAISQKLARDNFHVIMVGRNEKALQAETTKMNNEKLSTEFILADISKQSDCEELISKIFKKFSHVDVLINNAGVYVDETSEAKTLCFKDEVMDKTLATNTLAPFRLIKAILPLMIKNNYGRIVNVSSGLGSLDAVSVKCFSYSVSKASLNILTKLFASEVHSHDIKINSICPGWVKTDMGGENAARSIDEGISGTYWAATLPSDGPNGGFFRDGEEIAW